MRGFRDIIGQEHIKEHLQNAILQRKIAHAYIIQGDRFSGKEFVARVFVAALQCEKQGTEPCGECRSCKQVQSDSQPDIIYVRHEKPNSIGAGDGGQRPDGLSAGQNHRQRLQSGLQGFCGKCDGRPDQGICGGR